MQRTMKGLSIDLRGSVPWIQMQVAPVNDQLDSLALLRAQTRRISSNRVIQPSMLPLIKGSMASGFTSARHCRRQPESVPVISTRALWDSRGPGLSKQLYSSTRAASSCLRMRSLIAPAPGSTNERTSPSNSQLVTPGTQSTRSGVPRISHNASGGTANS